MLAGYGRLTAEQFSTVEPKPDQQKKRIRWERTALLKTLHRKKTADSSYKYDVVLFGPGGELIGTAKPEEATGMP